MCCLTGVGDGFSYGSHDTLMTSIKESAAALAMMWRRTWPGQLNRMERKTNPFIQGL
jgi:hypothetical protein